MALTKDEVKTIVMTSAIAASASAVATALITFLIERYGPQPKIIIQTKANGATNGKTQTPVRVPVVPRPQPTAGYGAYGAYGAYIVGVRERVGTRIT